MPCESLLMESPYYKLYSKQPDLKSLTVFGCAVYPWLRPYNVNKLQSRFEMCIFLGYSMRYKWVICYNPKTGKYIISRHIIFDETMFPSTKVSRSLTVEQSEVMSSKPVSVLIPVLVTMENTVQHTMTTPHHAVNIVSPMQPSRNSLFSDTSSSGASHHATNSTSSASAMQEFETQSSSPNTLSNTIGTDPLLPILNSAQLQVTVPLSHSNNILTHSNVLNNDTEIQTRLKTRAIKRQDYSSLLACLPELSSLQLEQSFKGVIDYCGFSFLADIGDVEKPKHFRAASKVKQWQNAMQEEFNALKAQGTWQLVPIPPN